MGVMIKMTRGLAVALLVATLAGCAVGSPDPPRQSSTPPVSMPPTGGPSNPREDGPLRKRLVDGLSADPFRARLVETGLLTVVPATWLSGWQVIDVVNSTLAHPQRFYLGLSADGMVLFLTAQTETFNRMVSLSDAHITSAEVATEVATIFLDTNRTFLRSSYRLESVEDIRWLPKLTADQTAVRDQVENTYGPKITKPKARQSGTGWRVSVWMVYDHQLIRHDLDVTGGGVVTDSAHTMFDRLPTPDSR